MLDWERAEETGTKAKERTGTTCGLGEEKGEKPTSDPELPGVSLELR